MIPRTSIEEVVRQLGVSDTTYYKWRKEYGGLQVNQAKRYKELEEENQRLRKVIANLKMLYLFLCSKINGTNMLLLLSISRNNCNQ
jgi:transposase-like protein